MGAVEWEQLHSVTFIAISGIISFTTFRPGVNVIWTEIHGLRMHRKSGLQGEVLRNHRYLLWLRMHSALPTLHGQYRHPSSFGEAVEQDVQ